MRLSLIQLRQPSHWIEPILQTVTSTRVRKITFEADFPTTVADIDSGINISSWSRLDAVFLRMANALEQTNQKLELVFKVLTPDVLGELNPIDPGRFLEGCRTKAIVRFERTTAHPLVRALQRVFVLWADYPLSSTTRYACLHD